LKLIKIRFENSVPALQKTLLPHSREIFTLVMRIIRNIKIHCVVRNAEVFDVKADSAIVTYNAFKGIRVIISTLV
jgi:hypothetical protein